MMKRGRFIEELTVERRAGEPEHGYTRQLLSASRGYDRAAVESYRTS